MKKSKVAVKSSVKKVSKNKKPISSLLKKALKKPLGKLLVKMSSKAKKPQVKVPAKPVAKVAAKPAAKALKPAKAIPVKTLKTAPVKPAAAAKGQQRERKRAGARAGMPARHAAAAAACPGVWK